MLTGGRAKQAFSVGAFALVAVAQASSFVHGAAVHHERCPEHGELVDVGFNAAHPSARAPDLADGLSASGANEGEHDHCSLATTQSMLTSTRAPAAVATVARPVAGVVRAPTPLTFVDDVLADAPKQGPPRSDV
jgi:hypothetical protein